MEINSDALTCTEWSASQAFSAFEVRWGTVLIPPTVSRTVMSGV